MFMGGGLKIFWIGGTGPDGGGTTPSWGGGSPPCWAALGRFVGQNKNIINHSQHIWETSLHNTQVNSRIRVFDRFVAQELKIASFVNSVENDLQRIILACCLVRFGAFLIPKVPPRENTYVNMLNPTN